ncbi:DUF2460 domain-containing protein [Idiomarina piscisalsi]|uniref:TIGR02217 family protein n=1 Tax=Idiomarina piscisalsi TaxID=1096243 RepID=A0A432YXC9_9GAMM|nr:DUF2460 domain-containing protein [Idiomarina piscisalsi]RUO67986.1 TIGR02217 family protein [Idiomarina piscisalsi]
MLLDIIFPEGVSRGTSSGPEFKTSIVQFGKRESRNIEWNKERLRVNVAYGIRTIEELRYVVELFRRCRGRAHSFKYKDWLDYKSTETMSGPITAGDQLIGYGDGEKTKFQLIKLYEDYARDIRCPKPGTVKVMVNGEEVNNFLINYNTGEIELDTPPGLDHTVRAGYEFYVPMRFDTDTLDVSIDGFENGSIADIPLIEVYE